MGLLIVIGVIVLLFVIIKFIRDNPAIVIGVGIALGVIAGIVAFFANAVKGGAGKYLIIGAAAIAMIILLVIVLRKGKQNRFLRSRYPGSLNKATDIIWFLDGGMPGVDEEDKPQVRRLLCEHGWKKLHEPRLGTEYALSLLEGSAADRATACNVAREIAYTGYIPAMAAVIEICWKSDFYDFDVEYAEQLKALEKEKPEEVIPVLAELQKKSNSGESVETYCRERNILFYKKHIEENLHYEGKTYNRLNPKEVIDSELALQENRETMVKRYAKVYHLLGEGSGFHTDKVNLEKFDGKIKALTFEEYKRTACSESSTLGGVGDVFLCEFRRWESGVYDLVYKLEHHPENFTIMTKNRVKTLHESVKELEETEQAVLRDAEKIITEIQEKVARLLAAGYETNLGGAKGKETD